MDTIITVQDQEALTPPVLDVDYQLSQDKKTMTVTITADKQAVVLSSFG